MIKLLVVLCLVFKISGGKVKRWKFEESELSAILKIEIGYPLTLKKTEGHRDKQTQTLLVSDIFGVKMKSILKFIDF